MRTKNKLKRCPFCGALPLVDTRKDYMGEVFVECDFIKSKCSAVPRVYAKTVASAVKKWNKRYEES